MKTDPKKGHAEERFKAEIAKDIIAKLVKPTWRRELVRKDKLQYDIRIRILCDVLSISTTCYFYKPTLSDKNAGIGSWLRRLTENRKQWDF